VSFDGGYNLVQKPVKADLGCVEYLVNSADGRVYYYDINPLSNFVADALGVLGFDPYERLVDYFLRRANL
jgi:hypothetical protein